MRKSILFVACILTASILFSGCSLFSPHPIDISAYDNIAAVLMSDGTVKAKGINNSGKCNTDYLTHLNSILTDYHGVTGVTKNGKITNLLSDYDYPSKIVKLFKTNNPYYSICQADNGKTYMYDYDEMDYIRRFDNIVDVVITDAVYGLKKDGTIVKHEPDGFDDSFYKEYNLSYKDMTNWTDIKAFETLDLYIAYLKADGSVSVYNPVTQKEMNLMHQNVKQFCLLNSPANNLLLFAFLMNDGSVQTLNLEEGAIEPDLSKFKDVQKIAINNLGLYGLTEKGEIVESEIFNYKNVLKLRDVDDVKSLSAYRNVIFAVKNDGTVELIMDKLTGGYTIDEIENTPFMESELAVLRAVQNNNVKDIRFHNRDNVIVLLNDGTLKIYDGYLGDDNEYFDTIENSKAFSLFTDKNNLVTAIINDSNKVLPVHYSFHYSDDDINDIMSWENIESLMQTELYKYGISTDGTIHTTDKYFSSKAGLLNACYYRNYKSEDIDSKSYILTDTNNLFVEIGINTKLISENILEIAYAGDGVIALRSDGTVMAFGELEGKVDSWMNIAHVYNCADYACAITKDGTLMTTLYDGSWED